MVESLLNYIGHKSKIVNTIFDNLPTTVSGTFYDMFSGSCVIGLNAPYARVACVEQNPHLSQLYTDIQHPDFHQTLTDFLNAYDLTNSSVTPRSQYLKRPDIGTVQWMGKTIPNLHLDAINDAGYRQVIQDFNSGTFTGIRKSVAYMVATIYGRNSNVATRADGTLSGGVGPLDYSIKCNKKFLDHVSVLKQNRHRFVNSSYADIMPTPQDFCYFDPPYLSSSYHYGGWNETDETRLLEYIDKLPCPWALSNSLRSGTKVNQILSDWCRDKIVIPIEKRYRKWAGSDGSELTKRDTKTNHEVLILSDRFRDGTFGNGLFEENLSVHPKLINKY